MEQPATYSYDILRDMLGKADIYLIDQVMRGRIPPKMRVLDAGCGHARNAVFLAKLGCDVVAVDRNTKHIEGLRAQEAIPNLTFDVATLGKLPFEDACFDAVVCNAVLHFASSEEEFRAMLDDLWRVLQPGGIAFIRLSSTISVEQYVEPIEGRRYRLPEGQEWFLVDLDYLLQTSQRLGADVLDPIKTSNVQNKRSMTTLVMRKP